MKKEIGKLVFTTVSLKIGIDATMQVYFKDRSPHTHTHTSPPTGKSIAKIWTEQADVKICVVQFYTSITMGCIANDGKDL